MGLYIAPYIILEENEKEYLYGRMMDTNGLPNYYPPGDKYPSTMDFLIDEVLFIPIDTSLMVPGTDTHHIGYRYLICTTKHQTISLGPDPLQIGVSNVELTIEVQRIVFQMLEKHKAKIVGTGDSLYPPRILTLEYPTKDVASATQRHTHQLVGEYNAWYLNRTI